ncbi:MAG: hypothetical protein QG632_739 [Candidatus Dependentiae bacterium]|nr:hypothetical protein [Candidatus Dependentiae bacterium]
MKNSYKVLIILGLMATKIIGSSSDATDATIVPPRLIESPSAVLPLSLAAAAVICGGGAWYAKRRLKKFNPNERASVEGIASNRRNKIMADVLSVLSAASIIGAAGTEMVRRQKTKVEKAKEDPSVVVAAIDKNDARWVTESLNPERQLELRNGQATTVHPLGYSVLHHAALAGKHEGITALLDNQRIIDEMLLESSDFKGRTPLMLACKEGNLDNAELFMALAGEGNAGAEKVSRDGRNALHYLTSHPSENVHQQDMIEVAGRLINKGCDPNASIIVQAATESSDALLAPLPRDIKSFDMLVDVKNMEFDMATEAERQAALDEARSAAVAQQLGAEEGDTPGAIAAAQGLDDVVDYLNWYSEVDPITEKRVSNGRTALMYAASCGNDTEVRALIAQGGDVAAVDARGNNALHYVAGLDCGFEPVHRRNAYECLAAALLLLEKGCDKDQRNHEGKTPAEIADKTHNNLLADRIRKHVSPLVIEKTTQGEEAPLPANPDSLYTLVRALYPDSGFFAQEALLVPDDIDDFDSNPAHDELVREETRAAVLENEKEANRFESAQETAENAVVIDGFRRALRRYITSLTPRKSALAQAELERKLAARDEQLGAVKDPAHFMLTPSEIEYRANCAQKNFKKRAIAFEDLLRDTAAQIRADAEKEHTAPLDSARTMMTDVSSVSDGCSDDDSVAGDFAVVHSVELDSTEGGSLPGDLRPPRLVDTSGVLHESTT